MSRTVTVANLPAANWNTYGLGLITPVQFAGVDVCVTVTDVIGSKIPSQVTLRVVKQTSCGEVSFPVENWYRSPTQLGAGCPFWSRK